MTQIDTNGCCLASKEDPEDRCRIPAATLVIGGCVHEHIIRNYVCLFHLSIYSIDSMDCRECWLSPSSHACLVHIHEVIR
jgi:hypothetical protein